MEDFTAKNFRTEKFRTENFRPTFRKLIEDVCLFAQHGTGIRLRSYQREVAKAIVRSVLDSLGHSIVVIFPRQSGKNELQANLEAFLLTLMNKVGAEMVKVSPTWKPQSLNAMRRLERVLSKNILSSLVGFTKEQGYIFRVGAARMVFLSGAPPANVVGATANILLECDEAQDVSIEKWDKEINPMAASTNATRVFWGTAWSSQTLLAREMRAALDAQEKDGIRRVFVIDADTVRREVPAYGNFVDGEIAKLGRNHPFIRTQFFSEEIDAQAGMFPEDRLSLMVGDHPSLDSPDPSASYAFLIDVGGEDSSDSPSPQNISAQDVSARKVSATTRDSSCLSIVQVDPSAVTDHPPVFAAPSYLMRHRRVWSGENHAVLFAQLKALIDLWQPRAVVIDSTGIGEGLASFLSRAFPSIVYPFKFSLSSKSDLGWRFISLVETGRFKDYAPLPPGKPPTIQDYLRSLFFAQARACQLELLPGPGRLARWGVPPSARHPTTGEPLHDDLLLSAALCPVLDKLPWGVAESTVISPIDPLANLEF